ncbi:hypothetical protein Scep_006060 [Stephania cephalantha]|uniref:Uncharacterized protein n=1 Tax=Stephania cephalantha TaxID=152367 RepID=A0AAP0K930_9MAGN
MGYNLLDFDCVMYKFSNFNHNPSTVVSSETSFKTSSLKHNKIILCAFCMAASFSSFVNDLFL